MTFFPSIPEDGHLVHVFHKFQRGLEPLLELHDHILREPSDLTIAERELIAAYVSALNDCSFCFNAHRVYAAAFGIDHEIFDALIENAETAPIDDKLKPLLAYSRKLTLDPAKMVQADTEAVLAVGWSEGALHDAVLVTSLFNFMNRIIFGHGLDGNDARYAGRLREVMQKPQSERLEANNSELGSTSYAAFGDMAKQGALPD